MARTNMTLLDLFKPFRESQAVTAAANAKGAFDLYNPGTGAVISVLGTKMDFVPLVALDFFIDEAETKFDERVSKLMDCGFVPEDFSRPLYPLYVKALNYNTALGDKQTWIVGPLVHQGFRANTMRLAKRASGVLLDCLDGSKITVGIECAGIANQLISNGPAARRLANALTDGIPLN